MGAVVRAVPIFDAILTASDRREDQEHVLSEVEALSNNCRFLLFFHFIHFGPSPRHFCLIQR